MAKIYIMETKDDNRLDVSAEVSYIMWAHDIEIQSSDNGILVSASANLTMGRFLLVLIPLHPKLEVHEISDIVGWLSYWQ